MVIFARDNRPITPVVLSNISDLDMQTASTGSCFMFSTFVDNDNGGAESLQFSDLIKP